MFTREILLEKLKTRAKTKQYHLSCPCKRGVLNSTCCKAIIRILSNGPFYGLNNQQLKVLNFFRKKLYPNRHTTALQHL